MPRKSSRKPNLTAIGKRIRQLRGEVRQNDFAPILGITQGQLSKIERGKVAPSVEVLLRLRDLFGKKVDWILTGKDKNSEIKLAETQSFCGLTNNTPHTIVRGVFVFKCEGCCAGSVWGLGETP